MMLSLSACGTSAASPSDNGPDNSVYEYEIGDVAYWHPGPTTDIFHDHDSRTIASGMEVIAGMDQAGIDALSSYPAEVDVLVTLANQ